MSETPRTLPERLTDLADFAADVPPYHQSELLLDMIGLMRQAADALLSAPDAPSEIDRLKQELAKYRALTPCVQHPNADHAWVCMHAGHATAPDAAQERWEMPKFRQPLTLDSPDAVRETPPEPAPRLTLTDSTTVTATRNTREGATPRLGSYVSQPVRYTVVELPPPEPPIPETLASLVADALQLSRENVQAAHRLDAWVDRFITAVRASELAPPAQGTVEDAQQSKQAGGEGTRYCVNHNGFSGVSLECPTCSPESLAHSPLCLRVRAEAPAQGTAWQDIATAPRGTPILLWMVAKYSSAAITGQISNYAPHEGRIWDGHVYRDNIASHWMPLPPPPTEAD